MQKDTEFGLLENNDYSQGPQVTLLFWLQVPVHDPQTVQMIQSKGKFCEVEFHIFLCKHNLIRTGEIYLLISALKAKITF